MRALYAAVVAAVACVMVGCTTMAVSKSGSPAVGMKVQNLIDTHAGQKIEIYNPAGEKVDKLPELSGKETGSVSIYNAEMTGQDNYTFNSKYIITKHLSSYGDDFPAGKWTEVK